MSSQPPSAGLRINLPGRRNRPDGNWTDVATALESEVSLVDQPRGQESEYRVLAINKAGSGEASNTVMAVL